MAAQSSSGSLRVDHLSKSYGEGVHARHAITDISLEIRGGSIYGLIGLSGAGKSTLLRCMASLIQPTSGSVWIGSQEITSLQGEALRRFRSTLGMVFQHFNLLSSRTVAENIELPLEIAGMAPAERKARVAELLPLVGLQSHCDAYPAQLSGGEKQRVGIARALANRPQILFCDEATSALDPKTTSEILDLLAGIQRTQGFTMVLITHQMEVVTRLCDEVAVMSGGRIVESGPVMRLVTQPQQEISRQLLLHAVHEIPEVFLGKKSPDRTLLRLSFQGAAAGEPIIARLAQKYSVEANILMGWLDQVKQTMVGTLVIELKGTPDKLRDALDYLQQQSVRYEVLTAHDA